MREAIIRGDFELGERLPRELELAEQFGVSRSTVREALGTLSSENLLRTTRGATGGSFVFRPTADYISEFLTTNIDLLTKAQEVSLEDLLELRWHLEGIAARMAASRRTAKDLEILQATGSHKGNRLEPAEEVALNRQFHAAVMKASGNKLLTIAFQPILVVLEAYVKSADDPSDYKLIQNRHKQIVELISAGDADGAEQAMREHHDEIKPIYARVWRTVNPSANPSVNALPQATKN